MLLLKEESCWTYCFRKRHFSFKGFSINKQGSIKGLNDVYDEIYQRVFKIKSLEVQESLLDSLKKTVNISINPKYQ